MSSSTPASDPSTDFLSNVLTPGSSLHPTFLLILDGAFAALLCVFIGAAILTRGNLHILALMVIELCLWGSVKWYVNELKMLELEQKQKTEGQGGQMAEETETEETKKTI
ncbi:hypothetical protein D9619_001131 [Psilocybe cf. subviscida]|uniref:Uncharacterized protein n=1 Tax=Psilocybe cf. subviscida TaxID=2480587 RepID=A0A8H5F3P7_9AGAR|nr:hypothetical protein D9619_001131 [Psilocybe cf. subviscida]